MGLYERCRPILAFVKAVENRSKNARELVSDFVGAGIRYKEFSTIDELKREALAAVSVCIVTKYRDFLNAATFLFCVFAAKYVRGATSVEALVDYFSKNTEKILREEFIDLAGLESEMKSVFPDERTS